MSIKKRDVVFIGKTAEGNTMDMPITRLRNIEDDAEIKEIPNNNDFIPIIDMSDGGQMKKKPYIAPLSESGVSAVYNPNLLDNPDFKINQRGQNTYFKSGVGLYTVDRWRADGNTLVSKNENGIYISADAKQTSACIQYLEPNVSAQIENKTITLSASFAGTVYSVSGIFSKANIDNLTLRKTFGSYGLGLNYDAKGYYAYFSFINSASSTKNILVNWTKLELGGNATPFIPPDPTSELLKCQRYCQVFHGDLVREYDLTSQTIHFRVPMATTMRGTIQAEVIGSGGQFSVLNTARSVQSGFTFTYNQYSANPPTMTVTATKQNHGLTAACLCVNTSAPFVLSADIK